jgi:hypothetical protein
VFTLSAVTENVLPTGLDEWVGRRLDGDAPTPDEQSRTWDGRILDNRQAVLEFLAEVDSARKQGRALGPDVDSG